MNLFDISFQEALLLTIVSGAFAIYHLLLFLILRHRLLWYYFILVLGLTLHWSLYLFANASFSETIKSIVDKTSLTTAMTISLGLLLFTKSYLELNKRNHPSLSTIFKTTIRIVVLLPVLHIINNLTIGNEWLNGFLVLLAAIVATSSILLNLYAGFKLFRIDSFNRYYLISHTPIFLAAIMYIGTWFLKGSIAIDTYPIFIVISFLIILQLILFSILIGHKFKSVEDKAMQLQLDANKMLQHEVDKQTKKLLMAKASLENQNLELERTNQLKNKLFALLAHDIKTPLSNFFTLIELMNTDYMNSSELKSFSVQVKNEISNRVSMVDDLLQWSYKQLDGMTVHQILCDLNQVFSVVADEFDRLLKGKNIHLELRVLHSELLVDEEMLKVILRNLISNAIKFSQRNQKIILWSERNGKTIDLGVRDFGVGMDPEWLKKSEHKGRPCTSEGTNGEKGTGFGLLIVKDFTAMNGGQLLCDSEVDKGTNFILRFPIENALT